MSTPGPSLVCPGCGSPVDLRRGLLCETCSPDESELVRTLSPLTLAQRLQKAEATLAEYENAIGWHTTCTSCARVLDSAYAETVRRERAEAMLAELREVLLMGGQDAGTVRRRAIAILSDDEEAGRDSA